MQKRTMTQDRAARLPRAVLAACLPLATLGCGAASGTPSPGSPGSEGSGRTAGRHPTGRGAPALLPERTDPLTDLSMVQLPDRPGAPSIGPEAAPVVIVVFSDFQCPFCARFAETLSQVRDKYCDDVRVVFRNFPLDMHPFARQAAEASMAAHAEGRFWQFHDLVFANNHDLSQEALAGYAVQMGMDMGRFRRALDTGFFSGIVEKDMADGRAAGVSGTPTCFVNGRRMTGAQPLEEFFRVIDLLLGDR